MPAGPATSGDALVTLDLGVSITTRTVAIDLLDRSLLTDFLPIQGVPGLGLYLLDRIPPLRRAVGRRMGDRRGTAAVRGEPFAVSLNM